MARRKRDPDPNPFETRLVAMTVKAVEDKCTSALLIYETEAQEVKVLAAPASIAILHGLLSRAVEAIRESDLSPSEE